MSNIAEQCAKFHTDNPHVYESFCKFAKQAIGAGRKVLSANFIFERMRWEAMIVTQGDKYKLNNNYRAYYARMFERDNPEYTDIFRKRTSKADKI